MRKLALLVYLASTVFAAESHAAVSELERVERESEAFRYLNAMSPAYGFEAGYTECMELSAIPTFHSRYKDNTLATTEDRSSLVIFGTDGLLYVYSKSQEQCEAMLAEFQKGVPPSSSGASQEKRTGQHNGSGEVRTYLPWALDVENYGKGKCEITDLAGTFAGARRWAQQSAEWIDVESVQEQSNKILFVYYDHLIRARSIRTFYKDMATCTAERP